MAELDRRTSESYGLPSDLLMESAGRRVAEALAQRVPGGRVAFLCGPGNNGGDGLVAARAFHDLGGRPEIVLWAEPERYTGQAGENLKRVRAWELPLRQAQGGPDWSAFDFVVDALFGTGLNRPLDARAQTWVESLPAGRTLAVDIPSGLHAGTGQVLGAATRAALTVTFGLPKLGLLLRPGADHTGELQVVSIGFPRALLESEELPGLWVTESQARQWLPVRAAYTHKGRCGRVLVVAGSTRYPGAACLAALGALRAGAGYVTLYAPESVLATVQTVAPEVIGVAAHAPLWGKADITALEAHLEHADVLCAGPGLDLSEKSAAAFRGLLARWSKPAVLDADALGALPERLDERVLLTPHPGELARLLGRATRDTERHRLASGSEAAARLGATVLCKGAPTLVVSPDGRYALADRGTPVLAQGGSGDVLSGVCAALLGQGLAAREAGALGAYLHGEAGRLSGLPVGLGARHLAEWVPRAWAALQGHGT